MTSDSGSARRVRIVIAGSIDDAHNRLLKITTAYKSAGYEVHFVGVDRLARRPRRCQVEGLTCEYLTAGWGYSNWRLLLGYPIWMFRLLFYCLRVRADLMHALELDAGLPVAMATLFRRIPFLYDVQDNYDLRHPWPFPLKSIIRRLDAWVLSHADSVIVPDANRIVGPFAKYREKITVLPNCPPDVPSPAALPPRKGKLTVLALGHFSAWRGIDLLLEALAELPEVHLIMAGRFLDPALERTALSMPQVEYRGWVDWKDAIALGYEADVVFAFYNPAREINALASAQKWFDAMMTGTPVLTNREVANAGWIEEQNFGYLCPYGSKAELVRTLRHILENPEEAREKGRRARLLFEREYNWPLMEKKLLQLAARSVSFATGG